MSEKAKPFTVDPVKDAFRRMQAPVPPRVKVNTRNLPVVAPFSENGSAESTPTPQITYSPGPPGGHAKAAREEIKSSVDEGIQLNERLQRRKRRSGY